MGYKTYIGLPEPLTDRHNLVVAQKGTILRPGFSPITNLIDYLRNCQDDVWIIGGEKLYESTIHLADELHITKIEADYVCTKFFPYFMTAFSRADSNSSQTENGITFTFTRWIRITHLLHKQR